MAGTVDQMRAPVIGTDSGLHFLKGAWHLIRAPVAFTGNEHCRDINGAPGKDLQLAGKGIDKAAAIPIQSALKSGLLIGFTVDSEFALGQPWLPEGELRVYSETYQQTGFQGGLNWYRCRFVDAFTRELQIFSGRTIDVPAMFISGKSDWGTYQVPGALEEMQSAVCSDYRGTHLIDGAGHWVQQEKPEAVNQLLINFATTKS